MATQGPLAHTVEDFWRMVWEWKSHTIVMLTEVQEREQVSRPSVHWVDAKGLANGMLPQQCGACEHRGQIKPGGLRREGGREGETEGRGRDKGKKREREG